MSKPAGDQSFFDSRGATSQSARARPAVRDARADLRRDLGAQGSLSVDSLTGTARQLVRTNGALSAPRAGERPAIARDFVMARHAALGLTAADVDGLQLADATKGARGLTVARFRQLFKGIPAWDNDVRVGIDRAGRVVSVAGSPVSGLSVASVDPAVSASDALASLRRNVSDVRAANVKSGPAGARQVTRFANGGMARLVLFNTAKGARLAWHVVDYASRSTALWDAVVDARSGAVLYRQNLTKDVAAAQVYENHPGAAPAIAVDLEDYDLLPGATVLTGRWSRAFSDINDNDTIEPTEEIPPSGGTDFVYPFTPFFPDPSCTSAEPCAWDPAVRTSWQVNREQNGVQAFYLVSRFAQHLADPNGAFFTDASGSFELGGTGGDDPVSTQTDDGAATAPDGGPDITHLNNANMSTPPDGLPPRMQMYLFENSLDPAAFDFRSVNGGDDSGVVWHEYTHGLSNRLVINADGSGALSTAQSGAMGEAWSDWFASDFQEQLGLKTDDLGTPAEIDVGDYTDADEHTLRSQALDCPVGAVAFECPGGAATAAGGYTYGDFGKVGGAPEVHADGEIWAETLWDLRQQLTVKFGDNVTASQIAEIVVSDGMRLSPPEPSFLDMRNAILAADQADFGGALNDIIWRVFSRRGMGYFAAANSGSDTRPAEDFKMPPDPNGPKGTITGTVTDGQTGLALEGIVVSLGGHASGNAGGFFLEDLQDVTDAEGKYEITGVPAGTYPKLFFSPSAGYDPNEAGAVDVNSGETTVVNGTVTRNWAALSGGTTIESVTDDTGASAGCGAAAALDSDQGTTWSAYNPTTTIPGPPSAEFPTLVIKLPETIDVETFLVDPSAGCGDGASATTEKMTIETSADGATWQMAVDGNVDGFFTDDDIGKLKPLEPAGTTGNGAQFVRIKLLDPLRVDPECGPTSHCSGTDFIDLTEFKILGGAPNVLPSGTLTAGPAEVDEDTTFTAAFTDPDSAIASYDWDFDGNGTTDKTTTTPTTTFEYETAGTVTAKVTANDFRGGSTSATTQVDVAPGQSGPAGPAGPPGPPGPPGPGGGGGGNASQPPVLTLPPRGSGGGASTVVKCFESCTVSSKLFLRKAAQRRLGLGPRAGSSVRILQGESQASVDVRLKKSVLRVMKKKGIKRISVTLAVTAQYRDRSGSQQSVKILIYR